MEVENGRIIRVKGDPAYGQGVADALEIPLGQVTIKK